MLFILLMPKGSKTASKKNTSKEDITIDLSFPMLFGYGCFKYLIILFSILFLIIATNINLNLSMFTLVRFKITKRG